MANIKNMEMAKALFQDSRISKRTSFLGLRTQAVYRPTGSRMYGISNEYSPENGSKVERILNSRTANIATELGKDGKIETADIGNYRLEGCVAEDGAFAAWQLFKYVDFKYVPTTDMKFYEGEDVGLICSLLE